MAQEKFPQGWMVVDTIIPGVTEEMLDWWWVNMEKGYVLWCPDEHKGFKWVVPPPVGGHVGAVQIATESIDYGPIRDIRIEFVDPNIGTPEQKDFWTYSHLLTIGRTAAESGGVAFVNLSHQWEAIPGGCKMRSCMHFFPEGLPPGAPPGGSPLGSRLGEPPPGPHPSGKLPTGGGWGAHSAAEGATFKVFLPVLWALWQAVPDPAINRRCSLKIKKEGSKIIYVK
jgi:hypothetical protein